MCACEGVLFKPSKKTPANFMNPFFFLHFFIFQFISLLIYIYIICNSGIDKFEGLKILKSPVLGVTIANVN